MNSADDLRKKVIHSFVWAAAQSWGSKILTFLLFLILARLISPAEFGAAAAAFLILNILGILTEFGFFEALIQSPDLNDKDVNLPFFVSIGASIILSACMVWQAPLIEEWMGVAGLGPVITALAFITPLASLALFQEALYRRHLMFKSLALRTLLGTALGGIMACITAFMGWGVYALVVQTYVTTLVNVTWLWARPAWKPSFEIVPQTFQKIVRFSSSIFGVRVLDFVAVRTADIIVLTLFGTVTLGLYTAGVKLLQVLLLLFQSVLSDVALTFLAKIANDRARVMALYIKTTSMSIAVLSPAFVLMAAVAPELCDVMFGKQWIMIDQIVRPFLLLGAVQCVQYLNGAYYTALGRPIYSFLLQLIRIAALVPVFLFGRDENVFLFVTFFCIAQTCVTIPSFVFIRRVLGVDLVELIKGYVPFILSSAISFFAVELIHDDVAAFIPGSFLRGMVLGAVFMIVYAAGVLIMARKQAYAIITFLKNLRAAAA
ncbi:MAG: hypothetical protein EB059_01410 [Alphaproteobacteria bacterium]|nr:hypothetical protein [Alphaproteobacteria bacterium]